MVKHVFVPLFFVVFEIEVRVVGRKSIKKA